jgi:hypothetical protein
MKMMKPFGLPIFFILAFSLNVFAQVEVSGSSGADGSYTTLKAAFDAVNASAQTGNNIDIAITGDTTETATAELLSGGWAALRIHPSGGARTVQGNLPELYNPDTDPLNAAYSPPNNAIIKLTGADNVTIDGSLSGGTDRSLTITNTADGGNNRGIVILIKTAGIGNGADNNIVKNTILSGTRGASVVNNGTYCILSFNDPEPNQYGGVSVPNSNNTIENNLMKKARVGIYVSSSLVTTLDPNWVITDNTFGSTVSSDKLSELAINVWRAQNFRVSNNTINGIFNIPLYSATLIPYGMLIRKSDGGEVTGNRISDIKQTIQKPSGAPVTYCSYVRGMGFFSNSTAATITIANNFIWDLAGSGCHSSWQALTIFGMYITNGKYDVFHNSVNLNTNSSQYHYTGAILVSNSQGSAVDLRNNIFANTATIGTRYAIYAYSDTTFLNIDYNDYFAQYVGVFNDGVSPSYRRTTLADWRAVTGQDLNSKAVNPLFVSPTDLHLQGTSPMIDAGTFLAAITTDIDGQTRPLGSALDIGADETVVTMPATATIGGRVLKSSGMGIKNATVTLSGGTLSQPISVTTGNSGAYQFPAVATGQTYLLTVTANGYTFSNPTQVIYLTANVPEANFTAN